MRSKHLLALALSLFACADAPGFAAPASTPISYAQPSHSSMPPRRISDCVTYVLLDNKCTADWYKCSDGDQRGRCVQAWRSCCTLPGNPARTTIVTAPQTP